MALFKRQSSNPSEVSQVEYNQPSGRRLPMLFIALAVALLVALALFYGARWVYRSIFDSDEPEPVSVQTTGDSTLSPQENATPQPSPTPTTTPTPNPNALPNNGPGDVAAIFAGTSLAAAGLHYIISLRRQRSFN